MTERNAIITGARITNDDHGCLIAWVDLDYGEGSCQSFGGNILYLPKTFLHHAGQENYAGHFLWRVMEIGGVTEWSRIVGKTVRVRQTHEEVQAIGHIVKDDWFTPREEFKKLAEVGVGAL